MKKKIILALAFTFALFFVFKIVAANDGRLLKQAISSNQSTTLETQTETLPIETTTKKANTSITFSFLGDCMMASFKGQKTNGSMNWCLDNYDYTYFFEKTAPYIYNDDFTIANCENVFTDTYTTEIYKDYSPAYWYRSAYKNANVFSQNSIDAVSIANNHIKDYGENGKTDTKHALEDANVLWGNDDQIIKLEKDGIKFYILAVNFWGSWQQDTICKKLEEIKDESDIQIVYFHGGTERIHYPDSWKVTGCKKFVDCGADLVLGGHPHVLQPLEKYNDVNIVYSLGNFCYGGSRSPENRTIIYQHTFTFNQDKELVSSKEKIIPFYVYTTSTNNWQPSPIEDETQSQNVLDFMYQKRSSPF